MEEKVKLKPREMTFAERDRFIEAGLDQMYCEFPDFNTDQKAFLKKTREQTRWIAENIFHIEDMDAVSDQELTAAAVKTITLTVNGQQEETKN